MGSRPLTEVKSNRRLRLSGEAWLQLRRTASLLGVFDVKEQVD
jgi:hypothetical protein